MIYAWTLIIVGCVLLSFGADRFVTGVAVVARNLGVSPLVIGIVLVGFATSSPEMLVAAMAAINGAPALALGNAVGSNIANICLAIGSAALVSPLTVKSNLIKREYPIMMAVMVFVFLLLLDGDLTRIDGVLMSIVFVGLIGLMLWVARTRSGRKDPVAVETLEEIPEKMSTATAMFWWLLGLALLLLSSRMLVTGAVIVAKHFGVSDLVIGLTVVALGTSLPEIAAAVASSIKNEPDIVLGNVIGSNLFNLLPVMTMPALLAPTKVPEQFLTRDYSVMVLVTILLFILSFGIRRRGQITRVEGVMLLGIYAIYVWRLI